MENQNQGAPHAGAPTQTPADVTQQNAGGTPPPAGTQQKPTPQNGTGDPDWLPGRLDRERKAILRELGVERVEDAKTALEELKTRRASEKTEHERVVGERDDLKKKVARLDKIEEIIKQRATSELASLTTEQRAAITEFAGDDPTEQLRAIDKFKPTWAKAAQDAAAAAATQQQTQQAPAPKKNTAPPRQSAPPQNTEGTTSHTAFYQALKKSNPFAAARYREKHSREIEAETKRTNET